MPVPTVVCGSVEIEPVRDKVGSIRTIGMMIKGDKSFFRLKLVPGIAFIA